VPLVIFDPRVPKADRGRVVSAMALNVDVPATIASMATGSIPSHYQGADLTPFVYNQPVSGWRTDFFCEHLMDRFDIPKYEGVRGERYVYARYIEHMPEGEFLHDLKVDPLQLKNFVNDPDYADVLKRMRARCDELRDQYGGEYSIEKFPTVKYLQEQKKKSRE
jgi:arylsulfatase A-like enzyme